MKPLRDVQLEFAWRNPESFHQELEARTGEAIRLTFTDNRSTMMSMRRRPGSRALELRLHRMFLDADSATFDALVRWVKRVRCEHTARVLDAFIRGNRSLIRPRLPKPNHLVSQGHVYDLNALYEEVNRTEFGGQVDARITWGKRPPARKRRSIRFGSYSVEENLIRIHPHLDRPTVPRFYIRYIVFHEMLHAHMGIAEGPNGRRQIHPPAFQTRERQYPDFVRAQEWERKAENLRPLLR